MLLRVIAGVLLQDAAGALGMRDEVGVVETVAVARHVAVPLADPGPPHERVLAAAAQDAPQRDVFAGRLLCSQEFGAGRVAHAIILRVLRRRDGTFLPWSTQWSWGADRTDSLPRSSLRAKGSASASTRPSRPSAGARAARS